MSGWSVKCRVLCFFFNDTAPTEIYTLPLHDALPSSAQTDPAQTDPAQTDPAQTDPAQTDPAQTDRMFQYTNL